MSEIVLVKRYYTLLEDTVTQTTRPVLRINFIWYLIDWSSEERGDNNQVRLKNDNICHEVPCRNMSMKSTNGLMKDILF